MKYWLRGKRGGVVVFLLIAALVTGGLGGATMAALRMGEPQTANHFIQEYLSVEGKNNPNALASTLGELILNLTYGWNNTLWFCNPVFWK